jgi:hypothetical protein
MYQALVGADPEAEFVAIKGSGHGFAGVDPTRANAAMVERFTMRLTAGGAMGCMIHTS